MHASRVPSADHQPFDDDAVALPGSEPRAASSMDEALEYVGFGRFQLKVLVLCGLCWMADAVEIMVLGYLVPAAQEEFQVPDSKVPLLASAVFAGMWFGLLFFGYLADRSGRRIVYISSLSCVFVFGLLSAFSPSFWTLVVTRLLVGFGVGGSGVAFAMFSEFLPAAKRGEYLVYIEVFWTVGTLIGAGIAWGTLTQLSWRWMVGLAALPALPPLFFARWLPESPRHLAISGRQQDALDQLRAAAIQNGTKLPADLRLEVHVENKRGNMKQLFTPDRRRLTFVLLLLAFVNCFAYYGLVIVTPSFFASLHNGDASESSMYLEVFIVSAAEFPGILASAYLINRVGRKLTQVILLGITGVASLMLIIDMPSWGTTIFAMLTRAAILGAYSTLLVFTVEAYPTHLRATAYGLCGAFSRIAGITTPFVAAIAGADDSYTIPLIVYGVTAMVAAALAYILPIETGGMAIDGGPVPAEYRRLTEDRQLSDD